MTRLFQVPVLLALAALPAGAQDAGRGFPLDTRFKAISISGFDVQKIGMTLTVARGQNRLAGSGHAGCNSYTATVVVRDDQIDFTDIVTTKEFCGKPRMTSEGAFLTTLKSAHRWRLDGQRLVIEGEAARLLLTSNFSDEPKAKTLKKPGKKPAKKSSVRR
jgi:heat shock protein HslJ